VWLDYSSGLLCALSFSCFSSALCWLFLHAVFSQSRAASDQGPVFSSAWAMFSAEALPEPNLPQREQGFSDWTGPVRPSETRSLDRQPCPKPRCYDIGVSEAEDRRKVHCFDTRATVGLCA
jgi:hypothetical protein